MIEQFIREAQIALANALSSFFGPFFDWLYLIEWYVFGGAVILICFTIGFFFPFKWIRAGLGLIVSWVIVAIIAATAVFKHLRKKD